MTLWFMMTIMIAIAAVIVSSPFVRKLERSRLAAAGALAVHRDQLKEIENEAAQGLIDDAQAKNASIEIKRRILASIPDDQNAALSQQDRKFALITVTAIVVFGSVGLYAAIGSPDLPSVAMAQRESTSSVAQNLTGTSDIRPVGAQTATPSQPSTLQAKTQSQTGLPPVEDMIQRLLTRLQRSPQDPEGWRVLGWSYFSLERFADAADAYSKAIELRPNSAEYRSARGEALVRAANGRVSSEALRDLQEALKLDPRDVRARFLVGLAKEQAGDKAAALADWNGLIVEADPSEPSLSEIKQRVTDLRRELGDNSASLPSAPRNAGGVLDSLKAADRLAAAPSAERGPRPEDIRNAESMSPQDRTAMIRGMVDALASRLEQSPRDVEGWIKLMRSRVVLGEAELARKSYQSALLAFSGEGAERARIVEAAQSLGLAQ